MFQGGISPPFVWSGIWRGRTVYMRGFGQIYQELVLSLPGHKRQRFNLSQPVSGFWIKKCLFGWQLFYTRSGSRKVYSIQCDSELKARYLRLMLEIGIKEFYIPVEEGSLAEVVKELERWKEKVDELIDFYLNGISSPVVKGRVRRGVYATLVKF